MSAGGRGRERGAEARSSGGCVLGAHAKRSAALTRRRMRRNIGS
jgi:hypothetical protein